MEISLIPCLTDNYAYIINDQESKTVGVVDPSESTPVIDFLKKKELKLNYILNTHHHFDHIGGNSDLKKIYNAKIVGFSGDKHRIPNIDIPLENNSNWVFGKSKVRILHIPGHTLGHICFFFEKEKIAFTGDTLFSLGCGRIFEGTYQQMLSSINKNKDLKNFAIIHFDSELSSISLYEDSSLTFLKTFPFGTNSIYRDITQLCLLKKDEIKLIFNELNFNNLQKERVKYLDRKFFIKSDFTKLSVNHLKSIIDARIEEMIDYIFSKNKNLNYLNSKVPLIYVFFEDKCVFNNLGDLFKNSLNIEQNKILSKLFPLDDSSALLGAAELILKGWHKEAIPFTSKKKSVISGFFSRFF